MDKIWKITNELDIHEKESKEEIKKILLSLLEEKLGHNVEILSVNLDVEIHDFKNKCSESRKFEVELKFFEKVINYMREFYCSHDIRTGSFEEDSVHFDIDGVKIKIDELTQDKTFEYFKIFHLLQDFFDEVVAKIQISIEIDE